MVTSSFKTPARSAGPRSLHPSHASIRTLIGRGSLPGACWGPGVRTPQAARRRPVLDAKVSVAVAGTRIRVDGSGNTVLNDGA